MANFLRVLRDSVALFLRTVTLWRNSSVLSVTPWRSHSEISMTPSADSPRRSGVAWPLMCRRHAALVALLVALAMDSTLARGGHTTAQAARPTAAAPASALSPRNANYSIDVDLDPSSRTIT